VQTFIEILEQHHRNPSTVGRFGAMDPFEHKTLQHKMRILLSNYVRTQLNFTPDFETRMCCLQKAISAKSAALTAQKTSAKSAAETAQNLEDKRRFNSTAWRSPAT